LLVSVLLGSLPTILEPTPAILERLNNRLGHLADSFWLSTDPTKRAELLEDFRILLEQRDALIAREFQVSDWNIFSLASRDKRG
jgi:hypothetical protein